MEELGVQYNYTHQLQRINWKVEYKPLSELEYSQESVCKRGGRDGCMCGKYNYTIMSL